MTHYTVLAAPPRWRLRQVRHDPLEQAALRICDGALVGMSSVSCQRMDIRRRCSNQEELLCCKG